MGYKFPLVNLPPATIKLKNNNSWLDNVVFTWAELLRLEKLQCIEQVGVRTRVVLPLTAVFSGKMRLVVDASQGLNKYLEKRDIVLEEFTTLAEIV